MQGADSCSLPPLPPSGNEAPVLAPAESDTCQHAAGEQVSNQAPGFLPLWSGQASETDDAVTLVRCVQGEGGLLDSRVGDDAGRRLLAVVEHITGSVAAIENTLESALAELRAGAASCNSSEAACSDIFPGTTFSQRTCRQGNGDDAARLREAENGAESNPEHVCQKVSAYFRAQCCGAAEPREGEKIAVSLDVRLLGAEGSSEMVSTSHSCKPAVSDSVRSELAMQEAARGLVEAEAVVRQLESSVLMLASQKQAAEDECGSLSMQRQRDMETIARLQLALREGGESCSPPCSGPSSLYPGKSTKQRGSAFAIAPKKREGACSDDGGSDTAAGACSTVEERAPCPASIS